MLVNYTASKKYSKRSIRKQLLSVESYTRVANVIKYISRKIIYKVFTNEDERQVSKDKMVEGGN